MAADKMWVPGMESSRTPRDELRLKLSYLRNHFESDLLPTGTDKEAYDQAVELAKRLFPGVAEMPKEIASDIKQLGQWLADMQ